MLGGLLPHTVTWWEKTGVDGYGKPAFATPTTLTGRWEDGRSLDRMGSWEEENSSARVFLSEAVEQGDYLYWGTSTAVDPLVTTGASEIKAIRVLSSIGGAEVLYMALLRRG